MRELRHIIEGRGCPRMIVSDSGKMSCWPERNASPVALVVAAVIYATIDLNIKKYRDHFCTEALGKAIAWTGLTSSSELGSLYISPIEAHRTIAAGLEPATHGVNPLAMS